MERTKGREREGEREEELGRLTSSPPLPLPADAASEVVKSRDLKGAEAEEAEAEEEEDGEDDAGAGERQGGQQQGQSSQGVTAARALRRKQERNDKASDVLNLSGLLNVLDGIVDCPSRIVIMTTNHPKVGSAGAATLQFPRLQF